LTEQEYFHHYTPFGPNAQAFAKEHVLDKSFIKKTGPVASMLRSYEEKNPARFHMPGHKGFIHPWDVTELSETDNLLIPSGAFEKAQRDLAEAYGAKLALFCTGGSTAGVLAMLLALPQKSTVALCRNAHKSAVSGLILGGHKPVWLMPEGVNGQVSASSVESALKKYPETAAVLVTSPDYMGRCADLAAIFRVCKAHGALLLVDGAHGAHLALSDALPPSPGAFADMWVTSAHKTLPCPNQGAYLFANACEEASRLKDALFLVHTTSPSFLLLSALDEAWRTAKSWDYGAHIQRLNNVRACIARIEGLNPGPSPHPSVSYADPTRLVISVTERGVTGYEADELLQSYGIFMEMADRNHLVAITSPADPDEWYERLIAALIALPRRLEKALLEPPLPPLPEAVLLPREAAFLKRASVPLKEAAGRICAESFGIYPPGCAAAIPGERIDDAVVSAMLSASEQGGTLFGVTGGCVQVIMD
jgi:arginine/lysine/ornithine decarboxylase